MSAILQASPSPITLAPIHNTFALLCCFVASALKQSWHNAARMPSSLLAAMLMPIPVPQIKIPSSHFPDVTRSVTFFAYTG